MVCKICGAEVEDNGNFCPECGAKLERQICCKKCGTLLPIEARFCPECGERFENDNIYEHQTRTTQVKSIKMTEEQRDDLINNMIIEAIYAWQEEHHKILTGEELKQLIRETRQLAIKAIERGDYDEYEQKNK
jgi:predicted amidophosphoribosyltransferase